MDTRRYQQTQENEEELNSLETAIKWAIRDTLKNVHTCLPGIIESFNPDNQTAQVQPAIKRIFIDQGPVDLPVCVDVPVLFPGGGDFFLTFPVKAGDECLLLFSERAIDLWFTQSGTQPPAEYRLHNLSDGIAIVGLNSIPNKLTGFNSTQPELRHRTGAVRIKLNPDGVEIEAPGNVVVHGDVIADGISLKNHVHGNVQSGSSDTGVPK